MFYSNRIPKTHRFVLWAYMTDRETDRRQTDASQHRLMCAIIPSVAGGMMMMMIHAFLSSHEVVTSEAVKYSAKYANIGY